MGVAPKDTNQQQKKPWQTQQPSPKPTSKTSDPRGPTSYRLHKNTDLFLPYQAIIISKPKSQSP